MSFPMINSRYLDVGHRSNDCRTATLQLLYSSTGATRDGVATFDKLLPNVTAKILELFTRAKSQPTIICMSSLLPYVSPGSLGSLRGP